MRAAEDLRIRNSRGKAARRHRKRRRPFLIAASLVRRPIGESAVASANVKLVKSLYDAFGRGEIATIIAALAPDVDWQVHGNSGDYPTIGRWSGQDGAREFFRLVAETEELIEFSSKEFCASEDKV